MHMLAEKILKEVVTPQTEKLIHPDKDRGLTTMELDHLGKVVDIVKDLLEIDCLMKKLGMSDPEEHKKGSYPSAHSDAYGGGTPENNGVIF